MAYCRRERSEAIYSREDSEIAERAPKLATLLETTTDRNNRFTLKRTMRFAWFEVP
jgi:hypothetical protein